MWRFTPQTCARQQLTSGLWEEYNGVIQIVNTAYLYMRNITATEQGKHRRKTVPMGIAPRDRIMTVRLWK